jgi:5-methylcytosine-specific restriction endonuclease McrA
METRTLLLNHMYQPHAIVPWQDSIRLVYENKVTVLEEYEETVSSPSVTLYVPAVILLKKPVVGHKKGVKFSRINVFTRDGFRCQYCGAKKTMRELNYDHVIPRRQGGRTVWENIVTCCYPCNDKKGGRTPEQAKMSLLRRPAKPHVLPLHAVFLETRSVPPVWVPYLNIDASQKAGGGVYLLGSSPGEGEAQNS